MGVSILSMIEIIYYITLRLACNLNYRRNKKIKARKNSAIDAEQVSGTKIDSASQDNGKVDLKPQ
jgi:hypothetical protein